MNVAPKPDDEALVAAAYRMLDLHNRAVAPQQDDRSSESDIRAAIRDLLIESGLARPEDMALESDQTDLRTGRAIIEVKRLIGKGATPDDKHIAQLDGYLNIAREKSHPERLGILTDGKHWALRPSSETGMNFDSTAGTRTFSFNTEQDVEDWVRWMSERSDTHQGSLRVPDRAGVSKAFGTGLLARNEMAELRLLFDDNATDPTIGVKRGLWEDLLGSALGEVVSETEDLDGLFVRHTYLATTVALALQASFSLDITSLIENGPSRLLDGSLFAERVGVNGVIESDFFGWPTETEGGDEWIRVVANRVASFDWGQADFDIGSVLYQSIISAEERRNLGEYYTPEWLAEKVVAATVQRPLEQRVLDPSCGSGTFLREAVKAYSAAAEAAADAGELYLEDALVALQHKVVGVDVHPVAVHLARASWAHAARELIQKAPRVEVSVPVYLGDSLQLRSDPNTLLSPTAVTVHVDSSLTNDTEVVLEFPKTLVDRVDEFDKLLRNAADDIEANVDPGRTIQGVDLVDELDREMLLSTLEKLKNLHDEGRNHIWAYYTRNLVRPVWLSTDAGRVDRIVGNPPWLNYNKTVSSIRTALETQAKKNYMLWPEPRYVTHADLAGLFYTRCVDLYLRAGGEAAMVMPHSALAAGQYKKWRTGNWGPVTADLSTDPWDLETLQPNDFFPIPACVVFASKSTGGGLSSKIIEWHGSPERPTRITHKSVDMSTRTLRLVPSPYGPRAFQGATIVPRRLFFVRTRPSETSWRGHIDVQPVSSSYDKEPWRSLELPFLHNTIPDDYIHDIHRGDTIAPFLTLEPHKAFLPFNKTTDSAPIIDTFSGDISRASLADLPEAVRHRWKQMSHAWEGNRKSTSDMSLLHQLDFMKKLTKQIPVASPRLVYSSAGRPTAAVLKDTESLVDYKLFWIKCRSIAEAHYLAAIINSDTLYEAVIPLMSKGQYGPRDLQKHLWRLNLREFDRNNPDHEQLANLGRQAARQAAETISGLRNELAAQSLPLTSKTARKTLRDNLASSTTGNQIEALVKQLGI